MATDSIRTISRPEPVNTSGGAAKIRNETDGAQSGGASQSQAADASRRAASDDAVVRSQATPKPARSSSEGGGESTAEVKAEAAPGGEGKAGSSRVRVNTYG